MRLLNIDRIGSVVLDRPQRRNAINGRTCRALIEALKQADTDPDIRAILLRAEGQVFCAGLDLDEAASADSGDALDRLFSDLFRIRGEIRKPIVGAVQGCAYGGGLGLVSLCHFVVASEEATFALPEVNFGMWPYLVFDSVAEVIGSSATLRMSLLGSPISAVEAKQLGLVSTVVPQVDLMSKASNLARQLAEKDPNTVTLGLRWSTQRYLSETLQMRESAIAARQLAKQSPKFIEFMTARRSKT